MWIRDCSHSCLLGMWKRKKHVLKHIRNMSVDVSVMNIIIIINHLIKNNIHIYDS